MESLHSTYTWNHVFPEVPKRIFDSVPNVKLIYLLRDPIDRIISHLHHDLYRGRFKYKNVDEVVLADSNYVQISQYYTQLSYYLQYFDMENILIMETSSLQKDTNQALNEICRFLGAQQFDFSKWIKARNQSSRKYLIRYYDIAHKYLPRQMSRLYHLLFYVANEKIARPILSETTLLELKYRLATDINELKKISGKEFKSWKTYNSIDLKNEVVINTSEKSY
ncbi:sulfotransferase domain-containing protein [Antarcticibacterium sp. 1MA-6-2]|uniref:sulfotransferase domain-containing protein n=1 Tax=Antarcticibacterium sp. 1MA-6-2 TaxID=2908210 RepID=UPI001F3FBD6E|nr:sulfotransferase domain-containing protein [Antarcticibacterium sp. 1MA-6-2]UJH91288.1 sulfotransferase domain-containing protein [Antarcticibacterium sp. 1MA-6-2]